MACALCALRPPRETGDPYWVFLHETRHWVAVLAPNQALLGWTTVRLKRHAESVADLRDDELLELRDLIGVIEAAAAATFGATMFNWMCLMNLAFRNEPPDPHVHWHCAPRYRQPVEFGGRTFEDPEFAGPHHHERWLTLPLEEHLGVAEALAVAIRERAAAPPD